MAMPKSACCGNMSFNFVEARSLIMGIKGSGVKRLSLYFGKAEPNYVLRALGRQRRTGAQQPA
jgi:hypothetical protein